MQTARSSRPPAWTISFTEASKFQHKNILHDEAILAKWNAGNHDSSDFFRKMGESMTETERARLQCKSSMTASPARNTEERVSMEGIKRTVESAKGLSRFALASLVRDSKVVAETGVPNCLSHLVHPDLQEKETAGLPAIAAPLLFPLEERLVDQRPAKAKAVEAVASWTVPPQLPEDRPPSGLSDVPSLPSARNNSEENKSRPEKQNNSSCRTSSKEKEEEGNSDESAEDDDKDNEWMPKRPRMKFRDQMLFTRIFRPKSQIERESAVFAEAAKKTEESKRLCGSDATIQDGCLTWVNQFFKLDVHTELQFEAAFPIILLFMIDVIYPKKVRWYQVDWNTHYMHGLKKNHAVLQAIWLEVGMDKLPVFCNEANIEYQALASIPEKLDFVKQAKRWFDQRVQTSAANFDPINRRTAIEKMVRHSGRLMKFPPWMQYDKEAIKAAQNIRPSKERATSKSVKTHYDHMPEYKRLIWFLGSVDKQTM